MAWPGELTDAERLVWEAFPRGGRVDLRTGDAAADDPRRAAQWGPERTVRAEVIAALLLGACEPESGHVAAVHLRGARITGELFLEHADIGCHIRIRDCVFEDTINLYGARTRNVSIQDSRLHCVGAHYAVVEGNLRLYRCRITDRVTLLGARIGGSLNLGGSTLGSPGSGFGPGSGSGDGRALAASRLQVDSDVLLNQGFTAEGLVELRSARIGGSLQLREARLRGVGGVAMDAARLRVEGDVSGYKMSVRGKVGLRGAVIAGALFLRDAELANPGRRTLDAPGARFGADVVLDRDFRSQGAVRLAAAGIAGHLQLGGGAFSAPGEIAVDAYGLQTGGDIAAREATVEGMLRISGAQLTGRLDLTGARLRSGDATTSRTVLSLRQTTVREVTLSTAQPPAGTVDLRYATIGLLHDDPATWPPRIRLDGASYQQLDTPLPAAERLRWLARDEGAYLPQPYEHLAAMYRRLGMEGNARHVQLAGQRARRGRLRWYGRLWSVVQDVTVGYGYRPARAVGWLLGLLALGSVYFALHEPLPADPSRPEGIPNFNSVLYALDLLLPVVDFGQEKARVPVGTAGQWVAFVLIASGWILATAVAAGLARALNRP
ncbi:hypothetical protein ACFQLX_04480 [Streptomyces polyrhachis]|uniref:Membrane-associated oxidoreductase n=1 Tax=Streptomyces polyrhachis TaxID=1282885 RepID=A0ABW2GDF4_9ACTN